METIKSIDAQIEELKERRKVLVDESIANLPSHHPLYGKGYKHKELCAACKGNGYWFGLCSQKNQYGNCDGTGLKMRTALGSMQQFMNARAMSVENLSESDLKAIKNTQSPTPHRRIEKVSKIDNRINIYVQATKLAHQNDQIVGEESEYYVTLKQLEALLLANTPEDERR